MAAIAEPPKPAAPPSAAVPINAPPATPSPAATKIDAAPDKSSFDNFDSAFDDAAPPPAPAAKPAAPAASAKPVAGAPAAKLAAKPEVELEDGIEVPKGMDNKGFRGWALQGYKKAKELERQLAEKATIEAEYNELKAKVPQTQAEKAAIEKQLTTLRSEHESVMNQFKLIRYEKSPEYVEKYDKPYKAEIDSALSQIKELLVEVPDPNGEIGEDGVTVKVVERPATQGDFEAVFTQPLGAATKLAKKLFGDAAPIVLQHRQAIKDLASKAQTAISEYRTKHTEIEKQQGEQAIVERSNIEKLWKEANDRIAVDPRGKVLWGEDDSDPEIGKELQKGLALADKRFSASYNALPTPQKILLDATIRHRVAASYKLAHINRKLTADNEQLKKDIAELRDSAPGERRATGGEAPAVETDSVMAEFDKM